jgi:hypothetical protein
MLRVGSNTISRRFRSSSDTPATGAAFAFRFSSREAVAVQLGEIPSMGGTDPRRLSRLNQRTSAELRVKSFSHEERQRRLVEFEILTARGEELNLAREKLFRDL